MKKRIAPQEKKIRDYLNQRTNSYGENDKSSRKAIRVRKAWVNRSFRRKVNSIIAVKHDDWQQVESKIKSAKKLNWKKYPDECLLKSFEHKWSNNSRVFYLSDGKKNLQREASRRLNKIKTRVYY